jgi:hypothetical protein
MQDGLLAGVAPKVVAAWQSASHMRDPRSDPDMTVTLLAALAWGRTWEITGALVALLLRVVHAIGARADRKMTEQLVAEFKKVPGKENMLFRIAEASAARAGRAGAACGVRGCRRGQPAEPGRGVQADWAGVPAH